MSKQERVRIYTVPKVADVVKPSLNAGTILHADGVWEGLSEDSVIIEVLSEDAEMLDGLVQAVALVASHLGEDAIMVTREAVDAVLVWTDQAWTGSVR